MKSINNQAELENADPETLQFHTTLKSIARMLITWLPFSKLDEEKYAKHLTGNWKVYYESIKEWQSCDLKEHRKNFLSKPLILGVLIGFFDIDMGEVFDFIAHRIIQRQGELYFPPHHLDPACWVNNKGVRNCPVLGLPQEEIVRMSEDLVVFRGVIPPRHYVLKLGDLFYATNTSRPVWVGDGWAYQLMKKYGTQKDFEKNGVAG